MSVVDLNLTYGIAIFRFKGRGWFTFNIWQYSGQMGVVDSHLTYCNIQQNWYGWFTITILQYTDNRVCCVFCDHYTCIVTVVTENALQKVHKKNTLLLRDQLKFASGCFIFSLCWRPNCDLRLFLSLVGLLSHWHVPHFHSPFYF